MEPFKPDTGSTMVYMQACVQISPWIQDLHSLIDGLEPKTQHSQNTIISWIRQKVTCNSRKESPTK